MRSSDDLPERTSTAQGSVADASEGSAATCRRRAAAFGGRLTRPLLGPKPGASDWRQTARVMIASAAAFVLYEVFGLPQGYWSVFTVVIVMQGSVGSTLGASTDRMMGTVAGAVIGGVAAALHPPTRLALGAALVLAIGASTLLATIRPSLKVAPVTAAIMLLSAGGKLSPQLTVLYRVAEIAIGSVIGVIAAWLILPSPAHKLVAGRTRTVLDGLAGMMTRQAQALRDHRGFVDPDAHVALRHSLALVEAAMTEAEREHTSRLAEHEIPASVPRTLWRVRNDVVQIGRALASPLPEAVGEPLTQAAAGLLDDAARSAREGGAALAAGKPAPRSEADAAYADYLAAFGALRRQGATRDMSFETVGRVFGLAFALDGLHADLADFADRVDEVARGHIERADRRAHRRRQPRVDPDAHEGLGAL